MPTVAMRHEDTARQVVGEVVDLLFGLTARLGAHMSALAAEVDLSHTSAKALIKLADPAPMRELAARMSCDPSNITAVVDSLEERGLVTREPDPDDRRVKRLVLTEDGLRMRAALRTRLHDEAPGIVELTDAQRRKLRDLLARAYGS